MVASIHLVRAMTLCTCTAGMHVLDLGCSPGAWLQVACQALSPPHRKGCVIGVDLQVSTWHHPMEGIKLLY